MLIGTITHDRSLKTNKTQTMLNGRAILNRKNCNIKFMLPFGKPVEPLVYIITAVSSGQGGMRDCETILRRY